MPSHTLRDIGLTARQVRTFVDNIKGIIGSEHTGAIQALEDMRFFDPGDIDLNNARDISQEEITKLTENIACAETFVSRYVEASVKAGGNAEDARTEAAEMWQSMVRTIIGSSERMEQIISARDGEQAFIRLSSTLLGRTMDNFDSVVNKIRAIVESELKGVNLKRFALWNGNPAKNLLLKTLSTNNETACLESTSFGKLTDGLKLTNVQANHPYLDMALWGALSRAYVRMAAEKISQSGNTLGFHVFVSHNGNIKGFTINLEYPTLQANLINTLKSNFMLLLPPMRTTQMSINIKENLMAPWQPKVASERVLIQIQDDERHRTALC